MNKKSLLAIALVAGLALGAAACSPPATAAAPVVDTAPLTCAQEGFTGTKLQWCKNICESDISGAQLDTWIHRWVNRYRDLPACAAE